MKILLLSVALLCCAPLCSHAQDFPDFGTATPDEKDMKECPFDKDAAAVYLMREAISLPDDDARLITSYHVKIKILKDKGLDEANITIPYYRKDDFENIENLDAITINTDENGQTNTEKVSKKAVYKKDYNERLGLVTFTFPNVKVGSIIEYRYKSYMKNYSGLHDWEFQMELPVITSKYTLTVAPHLEFSYSVRKRQDFPIVIKPDKDAARLYFEMNSLPGLDKEPYMDAREDYVQKAVFQLTAYNNGYGKSTYMSNWDEVIKNMLEDKDFGSQINKNIPGTSSFTDEVRKMAADEVKMKAVYNYVRKNMSWNDLYSKWATDGVKSAWEKKSGTSGEVNLVLINLLKEVGLEVYPVLVSERFHGRVNPDIPFIDQFNAVFACVMIKGTKYFLDATDTYTPANMTPNDILNTTALVVNKKKGGLINITNDSLQYNDFISTSGKVDAEGTLSGEAYVKNSGYARIERISLYKRKGKEKYIDQLYQKNGVTIADFEMQNVDNDSLPAEQKFNFKTSLSSSGDYLYVPLNMFTGFDNNPFLSKERFSNVNFGYKRNISLHAYIELPANYVIDALPKAVRMVTPDKDIEFVRTAEFDKGTNSLILSLTFDFKKSLYEYEEYPVLREVYKRIFEYLKEPVVLKKK
ncbi:MAG: DUF3857 and transglutaminase domain-containing protein [Bacteroidetes bacterium]|nr:DUF3857 and transglutaminase domain-containing protein [Bacteroidota bacterium]